MRDRRARSPAPDDRPRRGARRSSSASSSLESAREEPVVGLPSDDRDDPRSTRCAASVQRVDAREQDVAQRLRQRVDAATDPRPRAAPPQRTRCRRNGRTCESTSAASGATPRIAATSSTTSSRSSRSSSMRGAAPERSSSGEQPRNGCRRWRSSLRYVPTTTTRASRRLRARNRNKSRVEWSAQCRSSSTITVGALSPSRVSTPSSCSKSAAPSSSTGTLSSRRSSGRRLPSARCARRDCRAPRGLVHRSEELAQRLHHRTERHRPVDELEAAPDRDDAARVGDASGELRDEPALADAGLARDQHRRRVLLGRRDLEGRLQPFELSSPADEPGTRDSLVHEVDCGCPQRIDKTPRMERGPSRRDRRGRRRWRAASRRRSSICSRAKYSLFMGFPYISASCVSHRIDLRPPAPHREHDVFRRTRRPVSPVLPRRKRSGGRQSCRGAA